MQQSERCPYCRELLHHDRDLNWHACDPVDPPEGEPEITEAEAAEGAGRAEDAYLAMLAGGRDA